MNLIKKKIAEVESGYAVTVIQINHKPYVLAGSEAVGGRCVLINTGTGAVYDIPGIGGGIMSLVPVPECQGSFLAIRYFFPVFKSEKAEIVFVRMKPLPDGMIDSDITLVCRLPFVHRICLVGSGEDRKIVASTLCGSKQAVDDWSNPGAVYEIPFSPFNSEEQIPNLIYAGLHKNHGLFYRRKDGRDNLYICAEEGIFSFTYCDPIGWAITKEMDSPTGDVWLSDIDGDGQDELITIQPFHGTSFAVYKKAEDKWVKKWEYPLQFGHVAAAVEYGNEWYLLSSSRAGAQELALHKITFDGDTINAKTTVLAEGVAAAQAAIWTAEDELHIVTSSCGIKEISEFVIIRE